MTSARRSGEPVGSGDGIGEAGGELAGASGAAVVAHHDDGAAQAPRGEHRRQAGVAADRDDDGRAQLAQQRPRLTARPQLAWHETQVAAQVAAGEAALHTVDVEQRVRIRRGGQQLCFDAALRTDVVQFVATVAGVLQLLGDRQRRRRGRRCHRR